MKDKCEECGTSWDGGSILDTFKKMREEGNPHYKDQTDEQLEEYLKEHYSPPYRWGRQIGIELPYDHPDYYDGISFWACPDCGTAWNRFTKEKILNYLKLDKDESSS